MSQPFVSVKFTPAGRTVSFLLPELLGAVVEEAFLNESPLARPAAGATISVFRRTQP